MTIPAVRVGLACGHEVTIPTVQAPTRLGDWMRCGQCPREEGPIAWEPRREVVSLAKAELRVTVA